VPGRNTAAVVAPGQRSSIVEYAGTWSERLAASFWGNFGWLELPLDTMVIVVLSVVMSVAVLLSLRLRSWRPRLLPLLFFFLLTAIAMFASTYSGYLSSGQYSGIQGRYLFGALVPVFAAAAIGVGTLVPVGGRVQRWLPAPALALALASAAYGLWVGFSGFYLDVGWTLGDAWHRMVEWSPWPAWAAVALILELVLVSLAALAASVLTARSQATEG
jgi:hypothetical protein